MDGELELGWDMVGTCVVFVCHDGAGNVVMAKRGTRARDEPHRWDVGGGAIEFGRTAVDTVHAEVREEYTTVCEDIQFLGYRDVLRVFSGTPTHWLALDFLVKVDRDLVSNGEPHKLDTVEWFRLSDLPAPLHSNLPDFFQRYALPLDQVGLRRSDTHVSV